METFKMKLCKKIALGIALVCLSQAALSTSYSGNQKVTSIRNIGQKDVLVGFETQPPGTCSNWGEYVIFDSTTTEGKALLSALFITVSAGSLIDIWYTDSTAPGTDQADGCGGSSMSTLWMIRLKSQ
jgi:hypothetical protein